MPELLHATVPVECLEALADSRLLRVIRLASRCRLRAIDVAIRSVSRLGRCAVFRRDGDLMLMPRLRIAKRPLAEQAHARVLKDDWSCTIDEPERDSR
jgi:hypothetical protein